MSAFPWYFGRTVGEKYGQNKRLIQEVAKGTADPRWLGFLERALTGKIPPTKTLYIHPFKGTEEQKQVLFQMIKETQRQLLQRK